MRAFLKQTLVVVGLSLTVPALAAQTDRGQFRVASACGWYVITVCKPTFDEAHAFADQYGTGYVVNTSSPDFPNFISAS